MSSGTVIVDDMDPRVIHTGHWITGGTAQENDGTVSSTTTPGDFLTFSFTGSQVAVFGTIDDTSGGVTSTYAIDNGPPEQVVSEAGQSDTYRQLFWKSGPLVGGNHTLVVTVTKVNRSNQPGEGTVWFDYFAYAPVSLAVAPGTASSASFPSAGPTFASAPTMSESHQTNYVAAGGATVGAVILVCVVLALCLLQKRLRSRRAGLLQRYDLSAGPNKPTPNSYMGHPPHLSPMPPPDHVTPYPYPHTGGHPSSLPPHAFFVAGASPTAAATTAMSQHAFASVYAGSAAPGPQKQDHYVSPPPPWPSSAPVCCTGPHSGTEVDASSSAHAEDAPTTHDPVLPMDGVRDRKRRHDHDGGGDDGDRDDEHGLSAGGATLVQHVDSGIRTRMPMPNELPPAYTPN